ncbi:trace amine-associated receptor 13c-like [Cololabis saira]|uniref:trace amine-associated receptor 13c-like n=1 Tax=Cololabis saira TaxID=129043 RepID=UPI002AD4DF04|nr:trace amine-associated receptor 13c-like [Cololabis saira]
MEVQDGDELCFPQLLNSSCKRPTFQWTETALQKILISFISLITVALNLLVIISISHFRKLHTPTNIILLSLAVTDFLVGLVLMPAEMLRDTSCWFLGDNICVLYYYLICSTLAASNGNIILISVDRYVAICHPLHYSIRITLAKAKSLVCLCWLYYAVYSIFCMRYDLIQPGRSNSCIGECEFAIHHSTRTVDLILNFILPVTVIVVLYMRVFVAALSQARAVHLRTTVFTLQNSINVKPRKSEFKAARTLGILVLVYLICYTPYFVYSFVVVNVTSSLYASFIFVLFFLNSCINPIIYALFYSWFRKSVKLIVTLQILQPGSSEASVL